jgi:putative component of toxin-antitoxin plasmid stabilization module
MYTIVETTSFQIQAADIWSEDELDVFIDWLALNPLAGDVVPGTQGARKIRWSAKGKGKRSGARVIYFNRLELGFILLLAVYAKNEQENISAKTIQGLKNE